LDATEGFLEGNVLVDIIERRRLLKLLLQVQVVPKEILLFPLLLGLLTEHVHVGLVLFVEHILICVFFSLDFFVKDLLIVFVIIVLVLEVFQLLPVCA